MTSRIPKKKILEAIPDSGGIYSLIAKRLDVAWSTAKRLVELYPETQQAYADEQERMLDLAESKLYDSINAGDTQDVKWFLTKRGKKRGYGDSVEVENKGQQKVLVEYVNQNSVTDVAQSADEDKAGT